MSRASRGRPLKEQKLKTYDQVIGNSIREYRRRKYKTIGEFVDALNEHGVEVGRNCVSQWELGDRLPRITEIWRIADALGITLNTLIPKG